MTLPDWILEIEKRAFCDCDIPDCDVRTMYPAPEIKKLIDNLKIAIDALDSCQFMSSSADRALAKIRGEK